MKIQRLQFTDKRFWNKLSTFCDARNSSPEIQRIVAEIIANVETRGDAAVLDYTEKFDGFRVPAKSLRIPQAALTEAAASLTTRQRTRIREAIRCVRDFHRHGLPKSWTAKNPHGATVGERWYPIQRVGIYIPAGNVPLVSTAVMTTTLAKLAGVPEIAVFTPAGKDGNISPQMLAGLHLCGITEVYRIGGAQAIAAMAIGTRTIPQVCKIMGPGNAYVAEAQRQVFGRVGIDLLPGPSEAQAIADNTARPDWLAADLLAQAEHGSGREKVFLVHMDPAQAAATEAELIRQLPPLRHAKAIEKVLRESTLFIQVPDMNAAVDVTNFIAPEHLELHVEPTHFRDLIDRIHSAGAILCGHDTPTVLGDFTAGPSHTLPTGRTGRFFSGLKITDFMRRSSIVRYDKRSVSKARDVVDVFSKLEDLDAHGQSMEIRFTQP